MLIEGQVTDRRGHLIKKSEYLVSDSKGHYFKKLFKQIYDLQSLITSSCVFNLFYVCMTCPLFWRRNSESSALGYKIQIQFGVPKYVKKILTAAFFNIILFSIRKSALI